MNVCQEQTSTHTEGGPTLFTA